jgi:hypothetical protein
MDDLVDGPGLVSLSGRQIVYLLEEIADMAEEEGHSGRRERREKTKGTERGMKMDSDADVRVLRTKGRNGECKWVTKECPNRILMQSDDGRNDVSKSTQLEGRLDSLNKVD